MLAEKKASDQLAKTSPPDAENYIDYYLVRRSVELGWEENYKSNYQHEEPSSINTSFFHDDRIKFLVRLSDISNINSTQNINESISTYLSTVSGYGAYTEKISEIKKAFFQIEPAFSLDEDILDWDARIETPPSTRTRKIKVKFKYIGRSKPIPIDDPWT